MSATGTGATDGAAAVEVFRAGARRGEAARFFGATGAGAGSAARGAGGGTGSCERFFIGASGFVKASGFVGASGFVNASGFVAASGFVRAAGDRFLAGLGGFSSDIQPCFA